MKILAVVAIQWLGWGAVAAGSVSVIADAVSGTIDRTTGIAVSVVLVGVIAAWKAGCRVTKLESELAKALDNNARQEKRLDELNVTLKGRRVSDGDCQACQFREATDGRRRGGDGPNET